MARKSIIKSGPARKKKASARYSKLVDEKYTGPEPSWTGAERWSDDKLQEHWRDGHNYYNYHYSAAGLRRYVVEYAVKHFEWTKEDTAAFAELEDWRVSITLGAMAKMLINGAPSTYMFDSDWDGVRETVVDVAAKVKEGVAPLLAMGREKLARKRAEQAARSKINTDGISDAFRLKMYELYRDVDALYMTAFRASMKKGESFTDSIQAIFKKHEANKAMIDAIIEEFTPRMTELAESMEMRKKKKRTDLEDQLVEGYEYITKEKFKNITDFYTSLTAAIDAVTAVKKAVRKARVKKPPSKEKLVKKVKYLAQYPEFNLVSVNPVDIIGSQAVWVYNVKTRKLGRYNVAKDAGQMSVKGSAIVGYDEKTSIAKTLRKPKEQLKAFAIAGKVALRTFLEDIKAVDVNLNGRLNQDVVILKVIK